MKTLELRAMTACAVGPLERALAKELLTRDLGPELQLRYSLCMVAATALQKYLYRQHGIPTETVIKDLPVPEDAARGHVFSHVVLRHENNTIDPTYSQFMSYVGLRPYDVFVYPEFSALYPPEKIAVISDDDHEDFAATMAARMYISRPWLSTIKRDIKPLYPPDGIYVDASFSTIDDFTQAVWRPDNWRPYHSPSVDDMTDIIVSDMQQEG